MAGLTLSRGKKRRKPGGTDLDPHSHSGIYLGGKRGETMSRTHSPSVTGPDGESKLSRGRRL